MASYKVGDVFSVGYPMGSKVRLRIRALSTIYPTLHYELQLFSRRYGWKYGDDPEDYEWRGRADDYLWTAKTMEEKGCVLVGYGQKQMELF